LGLIVQLAYGPALAALSLKLLLCLAELEVCILEKYQAENRQGVLGGFQLGVGPQFIRRTPEAFFDIVVVSWHYVSVLRFSKYRSRFILVALI